MTNFHPDKDGVEWLMVTMKLTKIERVNPFCKKFVGNIFAIILVILY